MSIYHIGTQSLADKLSGRAYKVSHIDLDLCHKYKFLTLKAIAKHYQGKIKPANTVKGLCENIRKYIQKKRKTTLPIAPIVKQVHKDNTMCALQLGKVIHERDELLTQLKHLHQQLTTTTRGNTDSATLAQLKLDFELLKTDLVNSTRLVEKLKLDLINHQSVISELTGTKSRLESQIELFNNQIETNQIEVKALQEKLAISQKENETLQLKIKTEEEKNVELRQKLKIEQSAKSQIENQLKLNENNLNKMRQKLVNANKINRLLQSKLEYEERHTQALQKTIEELKVHHDKHLEESVSKQHQLHEQQMNIVKLDKTSLEAELNEAKLELSNFQKHVRELEEQHRVYVQLTRDQGNSDAKTILDLKNQIQTQQKETDELFEEAQQKHTKLFDKHKHLRGVYQNLYDDYKRATEEIDTLNNRIVELETELNAVRENENQLALLNHQHNEILIDWQTKLVGLEKMFIEDINDLKHRIAQAAQDLNHYSQDDVMFSHKSKAFESLKQLLNQKLNLLDNYFPNIHNNYPGAVQLIIEQHDIIENLEQKNIILDNNLFQSHIENSNLRDKLHNILYSSDASRHFCSALQDELLIVKQSNDELHDLSSTLEKNLVNFKAGGILSMLGGACHKEKELTKRLREIISQERLAVVNWQNKYINLLNKNAGRIVQNPKVYHNIADWATILYQYAKEHNFIDNIMTLYELRNSKDAEFFQLDDSTLLDALEDLETRNLVKLVRARNIEEYGVKFVNPDSLSWSESETMRNAVTNL
jgi:DNA repair exonuclease SbcCD ATPase subunit